LLVIPTERVLLQQGGENAAEEPADFRSVLTLAKKCGWAPPLPG
jgi:hypothetical protein